jgi:hypothetical protein
VVRFWLGVLLRGLSVLPFNSAATLAYSRVIAHKNMTDFSDIQGLSRGKLVV